MRLQISTLFLAAYTAVSAAAFSAEYRAATATRPGQSSAVWSLQSQQNALVTCADSLTPPLAGISPASLLNNTARQCRALGLNVTQRTPTYGLAHLVIALAAYQLGNNQQAASALARSARFAPFEGWLAERRFILVANAGMDNWPKVAIDSDLATLLTTQSGAELVAEYYLRRTEMRPAIAATASAAGQPHQARFLNLLRKGQAGL